MSSDRDRLRFIANANRLRCSRESPLRLLPTQPSAGRSSAKICVNRPKFSHQKLWLVLEQKLFNALKRSFTISPLQIHFQLVKQKKQFDQRQQRREKPASGYVKKRDLKIAVS